MRVANKHYNGEIAKKYGLVEAVVLDRIMWSIENHEKNRQMEFFFDGAWWMYGSIKSIQDYVDCVSIHTIKRALSKLKLSGIIISHLKRTHNLDNRPWYSVNYKMYGDIIKQNGDKKINPAETLISKEQIGPTPRANWARRTEQIGPDVQSKLGPTANYESLPKSLNLGKEHKPEVSTKIPRAPERQTATTRISGELTQTSQDFSPPPLKIIPPEAKKAPPFDVNTLTASWVVWSQSRAPGANFDSREFFQMIAGLTEEFGLEKIRQLFDFVSSGHDQFVTNQWLTPIGWKKVWGNGARKIDNAFTSMLVYRDKKNQEAKKGRPKLSAAWRAGNPQEVREFVDLIEGRW